MRTILIILIILNLLIVIYFSQIAIELVHGKMAMEGYNLFFTAIFYNILYVILLIVIADRKQWKLFKLVLLMIFTYLVSSFGGPRIGTALGIILPILYSFIIYNNFLGYPYSHKQRDQE